MLNRWPHCGVIIGALCALALAPVCHAANAPLGGFIPLVGIGLTKEFETFETDPAGTFFIADPAYSWGSPPLGPGSSAYFDVAVLDTGAATHILTQTAASGTGFSIQAEGLRGTNFQTIFGASGAISLRINDPLGVYAAGLGDRTGEGAALTMNTSATSEFRGQTSFALLEAPAEWTLPNIIGLPMAAQHAIAIRNSEPQIFQLQGRTVRTPDVELLDLGTGNDEGIARRTNLRIRPSAGFLQGPIYVQNLDIFTGDFHDNPLSPSVIDSGAMFVEIDLTNGTRFLQDTEFLFDTGADLSVISEVTAARLGIDVEFDQPDFFLEVEGGGGVTPGVPGFYLDELNIDTVGGSFTMQNVPVAVLDLPNPNDPANVVDGILGMHVFTGRDLVIDANPAASSNGGAPPRLYISDPVTEAHSWATNAASANWATGGNWSAAGTPGIMWDANVANVSGSNQTALVSANSTVYRLTVSGTPTATMKVQINNGATLTTYGEALIKQGGRIEVAAGGKLDAQFVNIEGGSLAGEGEVFVGTGPFFGQVRNLAGRVEPGDPIGELTIDGDYSQQQAATLAIDLSGTTQITQYDHLQVERFAFLNGTLQVNLLSFTPADNATFTILTAEEGIFGEFDNLLLPSAYDWDISYGANDVVLTVLGAATSIDGDFNADGVVDAADYVWLRKFGNTPQNESAWRSQFGESHSGSSPFTGVPEPNSSAFALMAAGLMTLNSRRRAA